MPDEVKPNIVQISETFRIDEAGRTQKMVVVMWKLGRHGPFSFEMPEPDFAGNKVKAEVEKRAAELRVALGPGV